MANTPHTTQSTYWYVRLIDAADCVVPGVAYIVAVPKGWIRPWEYALQFLKDNGMLPTNYSNEAEAERGEEIRLLPGYHLEAEIVEWEGDGTVARLFH